MLIVKAAMHRAFAGCRDLLWWVAVCGTLWAAWVIVPQGWIPPVQASSFLHATGHGITWDSIDTSGHAMTLQSDTVQWTPHTAQATGHVSVQHGSQQLQADHLTLLWNSHHVESLQAQGSPVRFTDQDPKQPVQVQAQTAHWDYATQRLHLEHHVVWQQGTRVLHSETLDYDLAHHTVVSHGLHDDPVAVAWPNP